MFLGHKTYGLLDSPSPKLDDLEDTTFDDMLSASDPDGDSATYAGTNADEATYGTMDGSDQPRRKSRRPPSTAERRATHNAVERARRESLNGRFMDLAHALPSMANIKRPSKSIIVAKSLEFVRESTKREKALLDENTALRRDVDEMRAQLGLAPTGPSVAVAATVNNITAVGKTQYAKRHSFSSTVSPGDSGNGSSASPASTVVSLNSDHIKSPMAKQQASQSPIAQTIANFGVPMSQNAFDLQFSSAEARAQTAALLPMDVSMDKPQLSMSAAGGAPNNAAVQTSASGMPSILDVNYLVAAMQQQQQAQQDLAFLSQISGNTWQPTAYGYPMSMSPMSAAAYGYA